MSRRDVLAASALGPVRSRKPGRGTGGARAMESVQPARMAARPFCSPLFRLRLLLAALVDRDRSDASLRLGGSQWCSPPQCGGGICEHRGVVHRVYLVVAGCGGEVGNAVRAKSSRSRPRDRQSTELPVAELEPMVSALIKENRELHRVERLSRQTLVDASGSSEVNLRPIGMLGGPTPLRSARSSPILAGRPSLGHSVRASSTIIGWSLLRSQPAPLLNTN